MGNARTGDGRSARGCCGTHGDSKGQGTGLVSLQVQAGFSPWWGTVLPIGYPISLFYTSVHHIRHLLKEEVFDFLLTLSRRQTRGLWRGERVVFQKRGRKLGKEMKEGAERGMRELSGAWEACVGAAAGQANVGR